jgi:hypothetical protein
MFAAALSGDVCLSDFPPSAFDFRAGAVHARQPHPDGDRVDFERSAGSVPDRDRSLAYTSSKPGRYSDADRHLDPFPDGDPDSFCVEHRHAAHRTAQRHEHPHCHASAYRHAHADCPSDQYAACHKHPTTYEHTDRLHQHPPTDKNAGRLHKPCAADANSDRPDADIRPDKYATSRPNPDTRPAANQHTTASTDGSPGNRSTTDRSTRGHDLSIAGLHMISEILRPPPETSYGHSPTTEENRAHESSLG